MGRREIRRRARCARSKCASACVGLAELHQRIGEIVVGARRSSASAPRRADSAPRRPRAVPCARSAWPRWTCAKADCGLSASTRWKHSGRIAEPAEIAERQAAIVMGVGEIRLEHRGALETGRGLHEFALGAEHVAEIVMRLGEVRLERHRALEQFDGVRPAELMGDDAEAVETAGMVRIGGADLAVQPLGLGAAAPPCDDRALRRIAGRSLAVGPLSRVLAADRHVAVVLAVVLAAVLPGIDKVKSRLASRIAATGCRTNITPNATGGGRP